MLAGAFAVCAIAFAAMEANGPRFVVGLERRAEAARDAAGGAGIAIRFRTPRGWLSRHAVLSGGGSLSPDLRARAAAAIAAAPGVGGARWQEISRAGGKAADPAKRSASLHCQRDVEAILGVRTIRFGEASAAIDPASSAVLGEVATALQPCVGSIIAITGHTDAVGDEKANLALSLARAEAVRWSLVARGIPADGLRASGLGSSAPREGLDPTDPANRRIEFSVLVTQPLVPTPVDTPGPG